MESKSVLAESSLMTFEGVGGFGGGGEGGGGEGGVGM